MERTELIQRIRDTVAAAILHESVSVDEADLRELLAMVTDGNPAQSLKVFWDAHAAWSQATFGLDSERGPIGALKHLAKEAAEAQKDPTDIIEFADCLFLTFDAARRAGFTFEQLVQAAFDKLETNKKRVWPAPTKSDEPIEHDRSLDQPSSQA